LSLLSFGQRRNLSAGELYDLAEEMTISQLKKKVPPGSVPALSEKA